MDGQTHIYFNFKDKICGFSGSVEGFPHLNTCPQYSINMNLL